MHLSLRKTNFLLTDGPIHENTLCIVTRRMPRKQRIRSRGQHQDIIRHTLPLRRLDLFLLRINLRDHCVQMVAQRALRHRRILTRSNSRQQENSPHDNVRTTTTETEKRGNKGSFTYPFSRIQEQILDVPVLEETRQAHAVIRQMLFLANHHDVVLAPLDVVLEQLLTKIPAKKSPKVSKSFFPNNLPP